MGATVLTNSLRILFISPYLPSLIRVRPFNLIKHLSKQGHAVTLLALIPPGEDAGGLPELESWCAAVHTVGHPRWRTLWNGLLALPGQTPFQAAYSRSPQMAALIKNTLAGHAFDVAHVEHLRGAELSRPVVGLPVVFDSVDSIALLFERVAKDGPTLKSRLLARLDLRRTQRYEDQLSQKFARVLVTSPQDKAALTRPAAAAGQHNRVTVLPNGVDLAYFAPLDVPRQPNQVIFSGKMSYHANVAAALDLATTIMPLVWQAVPDAYLVIAGKDPAPDLQQLDADRRIEVTGTVPDLRPYLAQAAVSVSPMRYGVGIQNKILEAMAMGTPVVTSPQTLTALQARAGQDLLTANSPQATAGAIISLLKDRALRRQIGQAGRTYVETHHNWQTIVANLTDIYRNAMAESKGKINT